MERGDDESGERDLRVLPASALAAAVLLLSLGIGSWLLLATVEQADNDGV